MKRSPSFVNAKIKEAEFSRLKMADFEDKVISLTT